MEIKKILISDINPASYNPRVDLQPGDPEYERLRTSIKKFDLVEPLIWNKQTGNLVGGHQRLKILKEEGRTEVDVSVVDLSEKKEKALNLVLNKVTGRWEVLKLRQLLQEIGSEEFTGFSEPEIDDLIDRYKIHDKDLCIRENNIHYVNENNVDDFNVFDLDDYGSPWKLLYLIIKKYRGQEAVFFLTDGLLLNQKLSGNINKWVSATEKIPKGMNIPGLSRWYIEIFSTMLLDLQQRYNIKIKNPTYIFNDKRTVCYWYFKTIKV